MVSVVMLNVVMVSVVAPYQQREPTLILSKESKTLSQQKVIRSLLHKQGRSWPKRVREQLRQQVNNKQVNNTLVTGGFNGLRIGVDNTQ
jgi:hypothetical protein